MTRPSGYALCAGIVVVDHVCEPIDHVPQQGELVLTDRMELTLGGCAANVAVSLTRLDSPAKVCGWVGADPFGRFASESLADANVDCTHLYESDDQNTSCSLIINTDNEDRRFIHSIGANGLLSATEIRQAREHDCGVLYVGGYCLLNSLPPDELAEIFRESQASGIRTVLDVVLPKVDDYWPQLEPVLPFTDVFLPNDDEAKIITGVDDPLEQAQRLHDAGAKSVVVTCGSAGAVSVGAHGKCKVRAFEIDAIDHTGGGDAFSAGFIYGMQQFKSFEDCLVVGSALGASCVREIGATTGNFTAAELDAFLADHPGVVESV